MREVTTHLITDLPPQYCQDLTVLADEPDQYGMPHEYLLCTGPNEHDAAVLMIKLQEGDPRKGWNGGTTLAILAALQDFLQCAQMGPFQCEENDVAIRSLQIAAKSLQRRIRRRAALGTFQSHVGDVIIKPETA